MVMFLDYGITVEEFALLNAIWAAAIVLLEVPSGALADLIGRRRLVVAGAALMVVEMLLLVVVPVPSAWVLPALAANRIVSGAAEAFISGADEALAFESLAACGRTCEWPRVLERLLRASGIVTIIGMVTGSLVYDPGILNTIVSRVGLAGGFTRLDTFRLPIWLTLASALGAFAAAMAMREPPRVAPAGRQAEAHGLAEAPGLAAAIERAPAAADAIAAFCSISTSTPSSSSAASPWCSPPSAPCFRWRTPRPARWRSLPARTWCSTRGGCPACTAARPLQSRSARGLRWRCRARRERARPTE
jgi:MFS family permease